jgi:phosphatidylinositol alpha-1,6-mannosyltransferase
LLLYAKMFVTASALILLHRIRVVHAGKNLPEGFVAYLLHRSLGVPYVIYAHGEEITVCSENPTLSRHQRPVYQNAAAVIVNSRFTHDLVRELGVDSRRIVIISPGVDPDRFAPALAPDALRRALLVEGKLVLLTVGRLQRRKGHDKVIEALPSILEHVPSLVYVIAGDGEEESALKELAEQRGVGEAVRFLGRVREEELPALYNLADIFIMANRTMPGGDVEGFGIVFLEASASGKPVIGGRSGGTADAIRNGVTGKLIDGASQAEIVEAVVTLAQDQALRETMGRRGREMVVAEYDWKVITDRIESVMSVVPK